MIVRPWQKGDTERILLQPSQEPLRDYIQQVDLGGLSAEGLAMVGEVDSEILIIAGLAPQWQGRAIAWVMLSRNARRQFVTIHRAVRDFLINSGVRRIEATVDIGFEQGHRWMKMLGFEPEGYMKGFRPDGGDQILYARVRR